MAHYADRSASDLARIYEAELSVLDDPYERSDRFRRLGDIQREGLDRPVEAFESFASAFSFLSTKSTRRSSAANAMK